MSLDSFAPYRDRMEKAGLSEAAICAFRHSYGVLKSGKTSFIAEDSILPVDRLPEGSDIPALPVKDAAPLLAKTVVIKLNGGLGSSMGLDRAKSLLTVRPGSTFLDLIARQILALRHISGEPVPFLLMDSYATSRDTREFLLRYPELGPPESWELMQNRIPKVDAHTFLPASWPADLDLEWCPPGHGDLYPSLLGSGWIERLLEQGVRFAFVSNADNLGATLDPGLLQHFAKSGAPFLMEVTRRTPADRKGGHIALDAVSNALLLRESAQCPPGDEEAFQDIDRHRYFNTNNIWFRLDALRDALAEHGGALPLPVIRNPKTIDPRDPASPQVYQLETAMGAAIACFPEAAALSVDRERFAPVKTTDDLFVLRSDACIRTEDHRIVLHSSRNGLPPSVRLDPQHFKTVDLFDAAFEGEIPSLRTCRSLRVEGPVRFSSNTVFTGDVAVISRGPGPASLPPGAYADQTIRLPL
ncbi:MAG TPA: UTP--glucose-1-phosphate uridylyltransferase [Verrucomicrobiales bacterium]|nr:UTP--glucose-1-phosphate uridylyltransferase [Verrucomicrobiales bacterium]